MSDEEIISLYFARDENAISVTSDKYGAYCAAIARNILANEEDEKECVNDTWLKAWQSIPPNRPQIFSAFLGKITRNLAFSRWRSTHTLKRGEGEPSLVLEELDECVSGRDPVSEEADANALTEAMNAFLASLKQEERVLFVRRYWHADKIKTIADTLGKSETAVSKSLSRSRSKLRKYLSERGFEL